MNLVFGGITVVAGIAATLLGGIAGDALRKRYPGSYFLVSAAGLLTGSRCFCSCSYMPFPLAWVFMFLAVFFLFFNTGPSNTILANVTHPSMRATAFALNILVIHALGDAISPPVMGWIADRYGMNKSFMFVSVMFLVGGLFWLWGARYLARHRRRDADWASPRSAVARTVSPPPARTRTTTRSRPDPRLRISSAHGWFVGG